MVGKKGDRDIFRIRNGNSIKLAVPALLSRKSLLGPLIILLFLFCGLLAQVPTLAETGPLARIDNGKGTIWIPALSEKNFIITSSYNGSTTLLRQPSTIVVGMTVPWRLEVTREGQTRIVKYETPAVTKETSDYMNIDGKSWMKKISLHTSYMGVYENVSFVEPIISQPVNSIEPAVDYSIVSENIIKVVVPRFEQQLEITMLGGGEPGVSNNTEVSANITEIAANASFIQGNISVNVSDISTQNISLLPENATETVQYSAEIGKPVRWLKTIRIRNADDKSQPKDIVVNLPSSSENVQVINTKLGITIPQERIHFAKGNSTGLAKHEIGTISRLSSLGLPSQPSPTGPEALASPEQPGSSVSFNDTVPPNSTNEYQVEYYTEAPQLAETENEGSKLVTVYSSTGYTNILTYTNIPQTPGNSVRLFWLASSADYAKYILNDESRAAEIENRTYKIDITNNPAFGVNLADSDGNGLIDRVDWITPHLSNQTFELEFLVLNPYTFLRDGEKWTVGFDTSGRANLSISSPNAGWTEFLRDNSGTFNEMEFIGLKCGDVSLKPRLKLIGFDSTVYDYAGITSADSIPIEKLLIEDYECNETGYLTNLMNKAGYARLRFDFGGLVAYAYDAATVSISNISYDVNGFYTTSDLLGWCNASSASSVSYLWKWYRNGAFYSGGDENTTTAYIYQETRNQSASSGSFQAIAPAANLTDGNWGTYARANGAADAIVYENYSLYPLSANAGSYWQVKDGAATANLTLPAGCWRSPIMVRARSYYGGGAATRNATWECFDGASWQSLRYGTGTARSQIYEDAMWWNTTVKTYHTASSMINLENITSGLAVGQNWTFECTAYDGAFSPAVNSTNITIINSVPTINTPSIVPASPNITSNLLCNATLGDLENTTLIAEWWWFRNGVMNRSGNTTATAGVSSLIASIGSGNLSVGDVWNCTARTFDGYNYSAFYSSTVTIANTIPNITGPTISPSSANITSNMQCNATLGDLENTTLIAEWWWFRNGVMNRSGNTTGLTRNVNSQIATLGSGNLTAGNVWNCTTRVFDGWNYSGLSSTTITIQNIAPNITSPIISPPSPNTTTNLGCNATAGDLENTSLVIEWYWYNGSVQKFNGNTTVTSGMNTQISAVGAGNLSGGDVWNCTARTFDGSAYSQFASSITGFVGAPHVTDFNGRTSNFNQSNIGNFSGACLEIVGSGFVCWNNNVNAINADFDSYANITANSISLDSSGLSQTFNSSANITLVGLDYYSPVILKNGDRCADCGIIGYTGGNLTFSVSGFSSYSATDDSNLTIWDSTDSQEGSQTKSSQDMVYFYANYTLKNGTIIDNSSFFKGICNIKFNVSGWGAFQSMTFNSTRQLYQFNRSFISGGLYQFNITCNSSRSLFNISAQDSLTIATSQWWNGSWLWRGAINISNVAGNLSQFQVRIDLTSVMFNFSKPNANLSDLRFTYYNSTTGIETKIPYYLKTGDNINYSDGTTAATIWVKVPFLANNTNTTLYMYYGNYNASSESNGTAVFEFFDDFSSGLSKWNVRYDSIAIVNGVLQIANGSTGGDYGFRVIGSNTSYNTFTDGVIEGRMYLDTSAAGAIGEVAFRGQPGSNQGYKIRADGRDGTTSILNNPYSGWAIICGPSSGGAPTNTWFDLAITAFGTNMTVIAGSASQSCLSGAFAGPGEIALMNHYGNYARYDNISVRKYASIMPITLYGGEEYGGTLNVSITSPTSSSQKTRLQQFSMSGSVNCTRSSCGMVSAYAQFYTTSSPLQSWTETSAVDFGSYQNSTNISIVGGSLQLDSGISGPAWYNTSWPYRLAYNLTNLAGNLTDYQIQLYLNSSRVGAGFNWTSDNSRIRFAWYNSSSGDTVNLPYWIEYWNSATPNASIWVKVPVLTNNTNSTIYVYYGNPSAANGSNASRTFDFYSDGSSLSGWTVVGASVNNGNGNPLPSLEADGGQYAYIDAGLTNNRIIEFDGWVIAGGANQLSNFYFLTDSAGRGQMFRLEGRAATSSGFAATTGWGGWNAPAGYGPVSQAAWHSVQIVLNGTTANGYVDGSSYGSWSYAASQYGGFLAVHGDSGAVQGGIFDNIRVRKYALTVPTVYPKSQENLSIRPSGFYDSSIFDAGYSDVQFQNISWSAFANDTLTIAVYSRSSADNISWSPWYLESNNVEIQSPSRRYVQYRVVMNSTSVRATPVLYDFTLGYYIISNTWQNMAPSGTIFTASNPFSCGLMDQTNKNCTPSWSVTPNQAGNYSVRICANSTLSGFVAVCSDARNISVMIQPTISEFTSSADPVGKGQSTTLQVRLLDDTGTAVVASNVSFVDVTGNGSSAYYIGLAATDSQGYADIAYVIPSNSSLGNHVMNASYAGVSSSYMLPVSSTKTVRVSSTPQIANITIAPSTVGFGYSVVVRTNVTDEKGLDKILINITEGGVSTIYQMTPQSANTYNYTYSDTWVVKSISFNIIANNTDGIKSVSQNNYFSVQVSANLTFATELDNYRNFQNVRLSNSVAGWGYVGWKYRRPITVTNAANISNYSLQIGLNSGNFGFSDASSNGSDVRFTYIDPNTLSAVQLPYWIESWDSAAQTAIVWVRLPIVAAPTTTVYIYYGNPLASSAANGTATFDFFDDFSGASLDTTKWNDVNSAQGTLTFSNGILTIASNNDWWNQADTSRYIVSNSYFNYDYIAESFVYYFAADGFTRFFGLRNSNKTNSSMFVFLGDGNSDHITNVFRDTEQGTADWYLEDSGVAITNRFNKLAKFVKVGDQVTSYINGSQVNQRTVSNWNLSYVALTDTHGMGDANQFDWIRVRKYVSSEPSISIGSSQNGIPGLQNNGDTTFQGYLRMLVQRWTGSVWQNIIPPVLGSTLYNVSNRTVLNISQIWDASGDWNTSNQNPGWYRVYAVMEDPSHNILNDSNGRLIESWYNFSIMKATLALSNLTYDNYYSYSLSEYETGDRIYWVNVSITSQNNTAFNANVSLDILDQSYSPVGWGPNETKFCGNMSENSVCQQRFDNSSAGYTIPLGAASGNYNFFWDTRMQTQNGDIQENNSLYFTLHNIPNTLSKTVSKSRLYKPDWLYYNISLTNQWSRNLTNVSVTINCPAISGFACSCTSGGAGTCIIGKLANGSSATVSFNVSANTSVASNDYTVNITLNYTNPSGQNKSWLGYMSQVIEVRLLGILEVTPLIYPINLTRGYGFPFSTRINNTGDTQATGVWINYTLPSGWSNSSGALNYNQATLDPSLFAWSNITAYVGYSSALGPVSVRIDASASDGRNDWKILSVYVYANTSLTMATNATYDSSQGVNWANRDDTVVVRATLKYDNGSIIPGKNISFYDSTSGIYIGSGFTNSSGVASTTYNISSNASQGYHTLNASFAGDSSSYTWGSFNVSTLDVRIRPLISGISVTPSVLGYGSNVSIQATITDDKEVDKASITLTYPNGSSETTLMTNIPPSTYVLTLNNTWQYGLYNLTIRANDTDGSVSYSQMLNFSVSVSASMVLATVNESYGSNQYVNLSSAKVSWWNTNWPYRRQVNLTNGGSNLNSYQINVSINLSSAYLNGNVQQDCRDLRFSYYNASSATESSAAFWTESCNLSVSDMASFWVKVPFIGSSASVYAYYGNSAAGSASNASATFDFYDDFLGSSLDTSAWDDIIAGGGSLSVSNSMVSMASAGDWWLTADTARYVVSKATFNYDYIAESFVYHLSTDGYNRFFGLRNSNNTNSSMFVMLGDNDASSITNVWRDTEAGNAGYYGDNTGIAIADTYNKFAKFVRIGDQVTSYINGTLVNNRTVANWNLTHVALTKTGGAANNDQFDWIRVRKYASPVPTSSVGAEEQPGSILSNSGATGFSGYLIMKVQRNVSGSWQDVATVINDVAGGTRRAVSGASLDLAAIWNNVSWYTDGQGAGTYRVYGELDSPSGAMLYGGSSYLNATHNFLINVSQPSLLLNISNIAIYDVTSTAPSNRHFYTNDFVDSGLNKTFNLYNGYVYRIEFTVNNIGSSNWSINATNVSDSGLNINWGIDPSADIWYSNKTLDDDKRTDNSYTGGSGATTLSWNTTQRGGFVLNGRNATFFFIVNVTQQGDLQNVFNVVHASFTRNDYSSFHIIQLDTQPPTLFNNVYNLTNNSFERGSSTVAYARWSETITQANVTYTTVSNTTWVYATNTTPQNPNNWTNFTLQSSSTWFLGVHTVQIMAKDQSNNWNTTLPYLNFTVWGRAQVTSGNINSSAINQNETVRISCLVTDFTNTNSPVGDYTVFFYNSTSLLGNSSTNSSGWGIYDYTDRRVGNETLSCNITESQQSYYHIDSGNYLTFNLVARENVPPYYTTITGPSLVHKADTVVLSTYWHDNYQLGYALLGVNSSGSWSNVSSIVLNSTDSYANFSYQIPSGMGTGYMGWLQFANDSFGNSNQTPLQSVEVWGWSVIGSATANPSSVQLGSSAQLKCRVTDGNSSSAIGGYNVTFWSKNSTQAGYQFISSNLTDNAGWANLSINLTKADSYTLLCNITDFAASRYNDSSPSSATVSFNVVSGNDTTPPYILGGNYSINASEIYRGECIKLSGLWNEALNLSWADYDPTVGSYLSPNVPSPYTGNWTNMTICTNSSWQPGNHSTKLYAKDLSGNTNSTLPYLYFLTWGRAQLNFIAPNGNLDRGMLTLLCNVTDYDTGLGINNYSVTFYDGTWGYSVGSNYTNSSGIAKITYNYSNHWVGSDQLSCVISNNNALYYKVYGSSTVYNTITLYGALYANITNPTYNRIVHRGDSVSLNVSVLDETGISPKDDNGNPASISAPWFNRTFLQIANGANTLWSVPGSYTLGPENLTLNVSVNYYHNASTSVNITVYGYSNVSWFAPPSGYYGNVVLNLTCLVSDNVSGLGVSGYNVEFFDNATSQGFVTTNSTGYALKQLNTAGLAEGNHSLSCVIYDNSTMYYNRSTAYQASISVIIDKTVPSISYNPNTDSSGSYSRNWILINITAQDNLNLANVLLYWNGTGQGFTNSTGSLYWINKSGLADGSYQFYAWVNDSAGNNNQTAVRNVTIDTIAPNITVWSPQNGTYYGILPLYLNVSGNENLSACWFSLDAGSSSNMVALNSTYFYNQTHPGQGLHNVTFYCNDSVGNIGQSSLYYFSIDSISPSVTLKKPVDFYNSSSAQVVFNCSASDNIQLKNVSLYGSWSGWSAKATNSSGLNGTDYLFNLTIPEGSFSWNCLACDNTNCSFASSNRSITVDTTLPTLAMQSPVSGRAYSYQNISLNYTAYDLHLSSCWYSNGTATFQLNNCQNTTLTNLPQGNQSITLYVNDSAGNTVSQMANFSIDLTYPSIRVFSPVNGTTYNLTNTLDLNYTTGDNFARDSCWYRLDGGGSIILSGCLNSTIAGLSNSNHSLSVYVNDTAGNINSSTLTFIINVTNLVVSIEAPLNDSYFNTTTINANATTNSPATMCNYSIDGGSKILMTNNSALHWYATPGSLSEGYHNITFYCSIPGNVSQSAYNFFRIDLTSPYLLVSTPQNNFGYSSTSVNLNYTASDLNPITCSYSVDGGGYSGLANCVNATMSLLGNGNHNVSVRILDAAGNLNTSLVRFYVDTIAPNLTIASPSNTTYPYSNIYFNVSGNENLSACWFNLDAGSNYSMTAINITNFYNLSVVGDGNHNLVVYCNDSVGNIGNVSRGFTVDTTAPVVTFVPPTPGDGGAVDINSTYVNITLNEPGSVALLEWDYNNGTVVNYTMSSSSSANWYYNVTYLADRTYYYKVWTNDTLGNMGQTTRRSVLVVTIGPAVSIISPQNANYSMNYVNLNVSANKQIAEWRYSLNGRANLTFSPNTSIAGLIGNNNLTVYAIDTNGKSGSASVIFNVSANSWYDGFDHYSGINSSSNITVINSTARINFCWNFYQSEGCWPYRKNLTLSGSSGALSNYQVRLSINLTNEYNSGKLNASCNDLRFTWTNSSNGAEGEIPYYVESCNVGSANASIWVRVPSIPTTGTSVMLYYGNLAAVNRSNGNNTFEFFDDFSTISSVVWGSNAANWVSVNGVAYPTVGGANSRLTGEYTFPTGYTTEIKWSGNSSSGSAGYYRVGSTTTKLTLYLDPLNSRVDLNNGTSNYAGINSSAMQTYSLVSDFGNNDYKLYLNHSPNAAISMALPDSGSNTKPVLYSYAANGLFLDWIGIRKYSSPEPGLSGMAGEDASRNNATLTSVRIAPAISGSISWQTLWANLSSIPAGTITSFNILDGTSGNVLLSCNSSQVQAGCSLSSLSASSVYIQALLGTNTPGTTPWLNWYNISWSSTAPTVDVNLSSINFSRQGVIEGEVVQVSVNVSNVGQSASGNFTLELNISLYNGSNVLDQRLLANLTAIPAGGSVVSSFNWTAKIGTYIFSAYADIFGNVSESSESNNNLSVNYTVASWQVQYGKYNYSVMLVANNTLVLWNVTNVSGNIYYSNANAVYNPSDLRPLNGTNFLSLADSALGMTYFNDSIRRLFDSNNDTWPDVFVNMTLAGTSYMVPAINSTNSSNFMTGVMYDSGDGTPYNGSQDLVFVTRLNSNMPGKYGLYDYEVRLPSKLAKLYGANQLLRLDEVN